MDKGVEAEYQPSHAGTLEMNQATKRNLCYVCARHPVTWKRKSASESHVMFDASSCAACRLQPQARHCFSKLVHLTGSISSMKGRS